jgi:hypothetical protein
MVMKGRELGDMDGTCVSGLVGWLRLSGGGSVGRAGVGCRVCGDVRVSRGLCEGAEFMGKVTGFRVMGLRGLEGMGLHYFLGGMGLRE